MPHNETNEKFAGTYRKLFDTIERGFEQCSTDRLQTLLEEKKEQLKLGLDAFTEPSSQARSKINSGTSVTVDGKTIKLEQDEKNLVLRLSDLIKLNELQAALIWDTFRQSNKYSKYTSDKSERNNKTSLSEDVQLLMNIVQFYFEDRLSLLQCISSLKRISMDAHHPYASIASDTISKFHSQDNSTAYLQQLFSQYSRLVRSSVPRQHDFFNNWPPVWAKQTLKEQKALLEIIFLYTLTDTISPPFILSMMQEFEADCFGCDQAFSYVLDKEGVKLRDRVAHICMVLSVSVIVPPSLKVGAKLDAASANKSLLDSPDFIAKINQIACYMGDRSEHAVFLLAWSFFLTCTDAIINDEEAPTAPANYNDILCPILNGTQTISPSVLIDKTLINPASASSNNSRTICIEQRPNMDRIYLGRSLKLNVFSAVTDILESEICSEEDVNNLGYRSVLSHLYASFLSVTRPQFIPMESYASLIKSYCLIYKHQPELCEAFWKDFNAEDGASLLATARRRFPVFFTDFVQLLSALTGASSEQDSSNSSDISATRVFEYLCNIPGITVVISPEVDMTVVNENNEVVVHADQTIQVTEAFDSITSIVVPEKSRGLLLSKADDYVVHYPSLHYSGWHLLVSALTGFVTQLPATSTQIVDADQFVRGENQEGIASILDLMYSVLSSNPSLVTELVQHVESVAGSVSKTSTTPILISVLCSILSTSSAFHPRPIPILTLAVKCMTLLLPYYREDIWAYLKYAPILPTTNTSFHTGLASYSSKLASSAQIQEIVSERECADGRYTLLLAFLDLVQALAQDMQRSWWINNSAQRQYQVEVLYTCLHYLMADVFPTYSAWRYKKVSERYLIGVKVLSIFIDIVSNFKEPASTATNAKLSLNGLREGILNNFLYSGVACHISPLVDVICEGARTASSYYGLGHLKEAERAEKLTEMTFVFVKILLQYRLEQIEQGTALSDTSLERLLLERTPNSTSSDFLLRIAKHIKYRHNISLPIQATDVLTLLCRTTAAWKTAPNFNQYLGSTAQVHVIIRLYLDIAKDQFQNEALLTSIWQLLTVLMETQPSLAILFLDCGDLIMPSPKSAVRTLPGLRGPSQPTTAATAATAAVSATDSAIRAATDILGYWDTLSVEKPAVCSNVLHFLDTFWRTALDHYALVERARVDNALWDGLGKVLLNPATDIDATAQSDIQSLDLLDTTSNDTRHDTHVRRLCCLNLSKAFVMRIIACEIHLTAGNTRNLTTTIADKLPIGLKNLLSKVGESSKLIAMRDSFVKNDFDPSIVREAETSATVLLQTIGVPSKDALLFKIPRFGSGDDGAAGEAHQYGDNFLYDYRMASNRVHTLHKDIVAKYGHQLGQDNLIITSDIQAVLDLKQYANHFLRSLLLTNYNSSIVDSQIVLLRAFKTFMETCSRRASDLMWANKTGGASGSDSLYHFLKGLVTNAEGETRDDGVALTSYSVLVQFIRSLTEDWISKNSAVVTGTDVAAQKTYASKTFDILAGLCGLLNRENYALFKSIHDDTAIRFHRPLLEAVMLIVRTLGGTIIHFTPLSSERMQFQDCYTSLLSVICSSFSVLTTKAITYSADESLVSPDLVENCIKDVTVVIAQLQELIHPKYGVSPDIWLDAFEKFQTMPSLLSLLFAGIRVVVGEVDRQTANLNGAIANISITPYAESALYLLLGLSNIPTAAEKLVKHNIYDLLTNNTLSPRLQQGALNIFIRFGQGNKNGPNYVERNPLHAIWCQILGVMNNLMCHVGSDELVLQYTVNLLQMYGPQIGTAFNNANGANDTIFGMNASESFSTPLLEEIDRINMLFFRLSYYLDRLESVANNLFVSYKDCTLFLLQRYLYFYTHPAYMQTQLYPMDNAERQQAVTFVTAKSSTPSSNSENGGPTITKTQQQTSQLMQKTVELTLTITHHMLTTLINLANTDIILTQPDTEWPFGNAIIYPDMRVIVSELSSFGTLTQLMNVCLHMLSQWQDIPQAPHKQLLNVLEDAALLVSTQSMLWIAKPDITDETRAEIAQETVLNIAETLNKTTSALTKLESTIKNQKIKEKLKTIHYLQQVLGRRFFTE
ncbi:Haloacid dehalogenase-like hydrolase domain-containing protein 3 [Mucor velutinosus]|uniref:Haloacid dehalogenase-like hydrolase domain-containing protein 3 n=1 Tax=Mucor velutinosus TaxID=708070 RepID=A0AAN7HXX1_9FUNG|nr:Haloacid dehalogenase-like hydrolase domain-containing protein 3 [Mucor velutinosus]